MWGVNQQFADFILKSLYVSRLHENPNSTRKEERLDNSWLVQILQQKSVGRYLTNNNFRLKTSLVWLATIPVNGNKIHFYEIIDQDDLGVSCLSLVILGGHWTAGIAEENVWGHLQNSCMSENESEQGL